MKLRGHSAFTKKPDYSKGTLEGVSENENWDPDAPVLLICRSGRRSGVLAQVLESKGFTKVASVAGGMMAYRELNLEKHADAQHQLTILKKILSH